jgi:hypothetical protein
MRFDVSPKVRRLENETKEVRMNASRIGPNHCAKRANATDPILPELGESPYRLAAAARHRDYNIIAA